MHRQDRGGAANASHARPAYDPTATTHRRRRKKDVSEPRRVESERDWRAEWRGTEESDALAYKEGETLAARKGEMSAVAREMEGVVRQPPK